MNRTALRLLLPLLLLSLASPASAQWYTAYEAGIAAARAGNWQTVVQKMSEAIGKKADENNKARAYGTVFINYHPYYYRGVAYLNLGKYEQAIDDLDRATGLGEENLGSIETLHRRAEAGVKTAAPAAQEPPPVQRPVEQPVAPPPVAPPPVSRPPVQVPVTTPVVDTQLESARAEAQSQIARANKRITDARKAKADKSAANEFRAGIQALANAQSRQGGARSAADWNAIAELARQASGSLDASITLSQGATAPPTLSTRAAEEALNPTKNRIMSAVEMYYAGDYDTATRLFKQLANEQPRNAMIWAFLGASQYSEFYLNGDENPELKGDAEESFRKAKQVRKNFELDAKYFSPRIQRFFKKATG